MIYKSEMFYENGISTKARKMIAIAEIQLFTLNQIDFENFSILESSSLDSYSYEAFKKRIKLISDNSLFNIAFSRDFYPVLCREDKKFEVPGKGYLLFPYSFEDVIQYGLFDWDGDIGLRNDESVKKKIDVIRQCIIENLSRNLACLY